MNTQIPNMPSPQAAGTYIDHKLPDGTFSVLTISDTGSRHREALVPGQWDRARIILTDALYAQVQKMWTDAVVSAWAAAHPAVNEPILHD